eukprot:scaffold142472_cov35-Tisochrysis_lutea.AAC.4
MRVSRSTWVVGCSLHRTTRCRICRCTPAFYGVCRRKACESLSSGLVDALSVTSCRPLCNDSAATLADSETCLASHFVKGGIRHARTSRSASRSPESIAPPTVPNKSRDVASPQNKT